MAVTGLPTTPSRRVSAGYLQISTVAIVCAAGLMALGSAQPLPVLGDVPAFPVTLLAAVLGWPLLQRIHRRGIGPKNRVRLTSRDVLWLVGCGALLTLPPILIDLALPFPTDINLPIPQAFLFYPAITLVAEVAFHLLPLAVLVRVAPAGLRAGYLLLPVVFVEPLFQMLFAAGSPLQAALVFCNVSLVSATSLWLFQRYGFAAMIGLRITFYFFWHILWGTARLSIPFQPPL